MLSVQHNVFSLSFVCSAAIFQTRYCQFLGLANENLVIFAERDTRITRLAPSRIILSNCKSNAASVWTLKRCRQTRIDVTKWNRVETPPPRADRRAARQRELFLLIKIHEHVPVFVCLLDSLREQMKMVPTPRNVNASSALISSRSGTLKLLERSAL